METRDELSAFNRLRDTGMGELAAALLVLAAATRKVKVVADETVGHEICMGVRQGLFGYGAADGSSVLGLGEITVNLHQ